MLVQDELQEAHKTQTATESAPTPRGHRPWLVALVAAGTLAGAAIVGTVSGPGTDPAPTAAHVSYDVVEANRAAALRDLAVPGGSYDVVEANRAAAWRDLVVPGGSYDVVEANRAAALRDQATAP